MVRMFTRLIEDGIAVDHIINNVTLGDFLGSEGLWSREIHTIIVSQMVVTNY